MSNTPMTTNRGNNKAVPYLFSRLHSDVRYSEQLEVNLHIKDGRYRTLTNYRLRDGTPWGYDGKAPCMIKQTVPNYSGFGHQLKDNERPYNKL